MTKHTCPKCGKRPVATGAMGYDTRYCAHCRDALMENPPEGHTYSTAPEDDSEHCECGKWLEERYYEYLDHIEDVDENGWDR